MDGEAPGRVTAMADAFAASSIASGTRPAGQKAAHQEAGEGIACGCGVHRLDPEGRLGVLLRSVGVQGTLFSQRQHDSGGREPFPQGFQLLFRFSRFSSSSSWQAST